MKRLRPCLSITFFIIFISVAATGLSDGSFVNKQSDYVPGELLVKFKEGVVKNRRNHFHQGLGAVTIREYRRFRLQHMRLKKGMTVAEAVDRYRQNPDVEYAEPNYIVRATVTTPNDPDFADLWGLDNLGQSGGTVDADIDAPEAWDISTGSNSVIIAVTDTGTDHNHEDLSANIWSNDDEVIGDDNSDGCPGICGVDDDGDGLIDEDSLQREPGDTGYTNDLFDDDDENGFIDDVMGWDHVNNDNNPMDNSSNGHGTHVAGIIGAVGDNGIGISGVNWDVALMPLKFLDGGGSGTIADAIAAINYAVDNGADIINASWGGHSFSIFLRDAIDNARAKGVLFVAAAGNDSANNDISPFYPAGYDLDNIISVAATDDEDNIATLSNIGTHSVDVGAPGDHIYSTIPGDNYGYLTGTSMATPHVSGVAGLILSKNPTHTYSQVKDFILSTVDILPSLTGNVSSNGRLNAFRALTGDINTFPPLAPSDLDSNVISGSEVELSWVDNSSVEDGFDLERKDGAGGTYFILSNFTENVTAYTDNAVSEGVTYTYRVKAYNSVGESPYSNEESATPFHAPTSLKADAISDSEIDLSWSDNSGVESNYRIVRKEGKSGTYKQIGTVGANFEVYHDTNLEPGTKYDYKVRAYNSTFVPKYSKYSNEASDTTSGGGSGGGTGSGSGGNGGGTVSGSSGGGCFIATAAYGSYLDPHVEILKDFRDDWLLKDMRLEVGSLRLEIPNVLGKAFVRFYYTTSPPIADYISRHDVLRMLTRFALTPLVYGVQYPVTSILVIFFTWVLITKARRYKKA